ncbi:SpoIIE family protein phosphatase [Paracoccus kondratievae]|uniref:Serine/threonine phosphatase n=1 Tax=Paracoccus kondratievae TaxID=135740 RepID=A0AAD3P0V5_9RHOB|nr:PP2C family serine/threonine-protein phosphatase [Paracoccus kondratievae]QFQ88754.1 SpoIIE family protein phosphatase [Paracoccus kondratievae]GLK65517.1 serine/threonine phosphatase [Paracoccus kondratievae]
MNGTASGFLYDFAALTDRGCRREQNEDSVIALPEYGVWAVADGMGGHAAGEIASGIIVEELASTGIPVSAQDQRARVIERIDRANRRIRNHTGENGGAGSTVAALLLHETELTCVWAGDSRIYLLRDGRLTRLTRDHSEVEMLIASGRMTEVEARASGRRNVITRAIGLGPAAEPELVTGLAKDRDRFLICSDGLTEHFEDAEIAALLGEAARASEVAARLIAGTLERGARDNVSVIVVDCLVPPPSPGEAEDMERP